MRLLFMPISRLAKLLWGALLCRLLVFGMLVAPVVLAEPLPTVRVGVLKFGTVNWELAVIQRHGLDRANGFRLQVVELGSSNATTVALQGGAVDSIVADWLWVARQRQNRRQYSYYPYSTAVGALLVRPDAGIHSLVDLQGKVLGVAGGPVDKNWLLYRAYTKKQYGFDLADVVEEKFAAPPLLNSLLRSSRLDAVLNYWHYNCVLAAEGMQPLISMDEVLKKLGIAVSVPMLGWVFDSNWALQNQPQVNGFLTASYQAKQLLLKSNAEWDSIRSVMNAASDSVYHRLRDAYRAGIPERFDAAEIAAIQRVHALLGDAPVATLPGDMFWRNFAINSGR